MNIPVDTFKHIKVDGKYVKLATSEGSCLSSYGISILEQKINAQQFIRVHRSTIINIGNITKAYSYPCSY